MIRAIGMVIPMENTAHGEAAMALMATSARNAMAMAVITTRKMDRIIPPNLPISSVAIWPRERPRRLAEIHSTSMSCTAPAKITPRMIHRVEGR